MAKPENAAVSVQLKPSIYSIYPSISNMNFIYIFRAGRTHIKSTTDKQCEQEKSDIIQHLLQEIIIIVSPVQCKRLE